jgi:hypothetical protein
MGTFIGPSSWPRPRGHRRVASALVGAAVRRRDWEALQRLLHPYLHWTDSAGVMVHGAGMSSRV